MIPPPPIALAVEKAHKIFADHFLKDNSNPMLLKLW